MVLLAMAGYEIYAEKYCFKAECGDFIAATSWWMVNSAYYHIITSQLHLLKTNSNIK
jgi:hypothetical protein